MQNKKTRYICVTGYLFMEDYLKEIKFAGIFSRIKRLNDEILYDTKEYYKSVGIDIEPNWHLIFLLLEEHNSMTISMISAKLRMSHPACVKILNKMKAAGYVNTSKDENDHRKQLLMLTQKSKDMLPVFHSHWKKCLKAIEKMMETVPHFCSDLEIIEKHLKDEKYKDRIIK